MVKPTVHDIARVAGVSLATVDRVLNARPGVRSKTIERVQAAISHLGYVRDTSAANLARQKQYRFAFLLPSGSSQFVQSLRDALKETTVSQVADRVQVKLIEVPQHDPNAIVRQLRGLVRSSLDGVAIMAPETPQVRDAVARLKEQGLAIVALVSDLPNSRRDYFIGIDNRAAGRTAALLMGRFNAAPGDVLVVTNTLRSRDSLDRRLGFDAVMASDFPHLNVLPTVESYDDPERMERIIGHVARTSQRLVGVYSMGPGNTSMLEALRHSGRLDDLAVIAHEVTPTTRRALLQNEVSAVITQNPGHLVRSAVRVLRSKCDDLPIFEAQERIRIEIVLRENLPDF